MNNDEFARRVMCIRPTLYRICCMQLANASDREDAIQEAIFKAWRKRASLREERYFNTWFIRILINECHNLQKRNRGVRPLEEWQEPVACGMDEIHSLRWALESLEEGQRMCVLLHHIEGYSVRDVAKMLKISESAAKQRLMRGRKRLKELLTEEVFES